jgi:hypothetical protein
VKLPPNNLWLGNFDFGSRGLFISRMDLLLQNGAERIQKLVYFRGEARE